MPQTSLVLDKQTLSYTGLFDSNELYFIIDKWLKDNGYSKNEIKVREKVEEKGKYLYVLSQPYKKMNNYLKTVIQIELEFSNMVDVKANLGNEKKRINQGDVDIDFYGMIVTDMEKKWESTPSRFLMRVFFDRFLLKSVTSQAEEMVSKDVKTLMKEIRSYLNIYDNK